MKTRKIVGLTSLIVIASFLLGTTLVTAKPSKAEFDYWQDYYGWGPALYYGQSVRVHYLATNTWVLNMKDNGDGTWTINQELTQKGFAYVYDITGTTLLDTKNFRVVEVTHGTVTYMAEWYHVYSLSYIKKHEYRWIITSVYHWHDSIMNGWESYIFEYWVKGEGWTVVSSS